jgi:hypothetical protein
MTSTSTDAWKAEVAALLDPLLDQYDQKLRDIDQRKAQVENDKQRFLEDFANLRRTLIRPAFEAAGAALERHGRRFAIIEQDYSMEPGGKATESSIALQVLPAARDKGEGASQPVASLVYETRHYTKSICIGGRDKVTTDDPSAGRRGDYQPAQIDRDHVRKELLRLFSGLVSR